MIMRNDIQPTNFPAILSCELYSCSGIAKYNLPPAEAVIRFFQDAGAEFYFVRPDKPLLSPVDEIESSGNIPSVLGIADRHLLPDAIAQRNKCMWLGTRGNAGIGFSQQFRELSIFQSSFPIDAHKTDILASGLRRFLIKYAPILRPKFSWLDASGDSTPSPRFVQRLELNRIFWMMFFGPEYVDKFGRKFLLNVPAWKVEDFGEAGISITTTEKYSDWLSEPNGNVLTYFKGKSPQIKPYRYKPVP